MSSRIEEYIIRVSKAVRLASNEHRDASVKITQKQMDLEGMSSIRNRILLNELIKDNDLYLEIGVWRGSTFIAALYENNPKLAVAIDNFSQFDESGENVKVFTNAVYENLPHLLDKAFLINNDCFNLTPEEKAFIPDNINVYFYDGAHEAVDQKAALTYYHDKLANEFIYIVDDWNYEPARIGTRQAFEELGILVHKEWELFTDFNGDRTSWWNGFYLAVCEKAK